MLLSFALAQSPPPSELKHEILTSHTELRESKREGREVTNVMVPGLETILRILQKHGPLPIRTGDTLPSYFLFWQLLI
jgi:hypothetical protein